MGLWWGYREPLGRRTNGLSTLWTKRLFEHRESHGIGGCPQTERSSSRTKGRYQLIHTDDYSARLRRKIHTFNSVPCNYMKKAFMLWFDLFPTFHIVFTGPGHFLVFWLPFNTVSTSISIILSRLLLYISWVSIHYCLSYTFKTVPEDTWQVQHSNKRKLKNQHCNLWRRRAASSWLVVRARDCSVDADLVRRGWIAIAYCATLGRFHCNS